jgi:hypothetical protein
MHGGGFAGAVRPKKAKDLTGFNPQRKIAQRRDPLASEEAAVLLGHVVEYKGGEAGHGCSQE